MSGRKALRAVRSYSFVIPFALFVTCFVPFTVSEAAVPDTAAALEKKLLEEADRARMVDFLAELSKRRRLTTIFDNQQSPFDGVQIGYTNTSTLNLTFLKRDLVRLDHISAVMGRVYDSRIIDNPDFGPGWRLAIAETAHVADQEVIYTDSAAAEHRLTLDGNRLVSPSPHLTGILGGKRDGSTLRIKYRDITKFFQPIAGAYRLTRVVDRNGNQLRLHYRAGLLHTVVTQNGRSVSITRNEAGRIERFIDDAGRAVSFEYDSSGLLAAFYDLGGSRWAYAYSTQGQLVEVTDPRSVPILNVGYDGRQVTSVRSLGDDYRYETDGQSTRVTNGASQAATFWAHTSGLTESVQDYAGNMSSLEFDDQLRITALLYNGSGVYRATHNPRGHVRSLVRKTPSGFRALSLRYKGGRLVSAEEGGTTVASYEYDQNGNVRLARDADGTRRYSYDEHGNMRTLTADGNRLRFRRDDIGQIREVRSGNRELLRIDYDELDRTEEIHVRTSDDTYQMSYVYNDAGFRKDAVYYGGAVSADINYDAVGNMVGISMSAGGRPLWTDRYEVDARNQLREVTAEWVGTLSVDYSDTGQPVRLTQGNQVADIAYDGVGRLAGVTVDAAQRFGVDYAPTDVDLVTAADIRTNRPMLDTPVASQVFGNLDAIAYTRPSGSAYGAIHFDASMARFVVGDTAFVAPDSLQYQSLLKRLVPVDGESELDALPMGYDKPSNALFLPPEFASVNCHVCIAVITAADIEVGGSDDPTVTSPNTNVRFDVTSDAACAWRGRPPPGTPPGTIRHRIYFGDGTSETKFTGVRSYSDFTHAYTSTGVYVASVSVACSCSNGPFSYDTAAHTVIVRSSSATPTPVAVHLTFDDGPTSTTNDNTRTVLNTLLSNPLQSGIRATFFVQTHVQSPGRGSTPGGIANMELALARGHQIAIHTGSSDDHVLHTTRVIAPRYDANGDGFITTADGINGLEGDMIRAKAHIESLQGGVRPNLVRAVGGIRSPEVDAVYARQNLTHVGWDIDSRDSSSGRTFATITAALDSQVQQKMAAQDRDFIVLFHDIHGLTADNLIRSQGDGYLQTIRDAIAASGNFETIFTVY